MRHKILIWTLQTENSVFQESLAHFLEEGGELFIALNAQDAEAIVNREKPQLIFIDHRSLQAFSKGSVKESHCYVICEKGTQAPNGYLTLERPLTQKKIADCCKAVFTDEIFVKIPPM